MQKKNQKNPTFYTIKSEPKLELDREKTNVPKKFDLIEQTTSLQLSLFQFLTETDVLTEDGSKTVAKNRKYSQTIELYDFMPRFVFGHQEDTRKDYNGLLPGLVRDFECRGVPFRLTLTAATIVGTDGKSTAYYPGSDEDILETVLRKMYLEDGPKLFDGQPGMVFTVNRIRKELKKQGKTRSHNQIIESLLILKRSSVSCQNTVSKRDINFNPIDVLSINAEGNSDEPCYLIFSDVLAQALDNLYFRRFNYQQVIGYKSNIARLLHRRISHHFTQANDQIAYTVNFTTLLRDFGLEFQSLARAYIYLKKAIEEMKKSNVIKEFKAVPIVSSGSSRKIEDYFLEITPTKTFSFEMSNSNKVENNVVKMFNTLTEKKKIVKKPKKAKLEAFFPEVKNQN